MPARRVMVVGLDCVPPRFAFDLFLDVMPNLARLMEQGIHGPMRSCVPPITVPAWSAMFSGRDPGELGIYGFQQPLANSYKKRLIHPKDILQPRAWHLAQDAGKRVAVLFMPPSYPPEKLNGVQISCFLTPDADSPHTYPPALAAELRAQFGPYRMDVDEFRTENKAPVLQAILDMTRQHFDIACHVWKTQAPDLMTMVAIGPDRFHHAFFREIEPNHPQHDPTNPFTHAGKQFYAFLDQQLGRLLQLADPDTAVMVVSDHGARPLLGGICINEWLIQQGYLKLHQYPSSATPFAKLAVDWSRTLAYGEGGYCGRIRVNQRGREPEGCVAPEEVPALLDRIERAISQIPDAQGRPLWHRVVRADHYRARRGTPPELQVFFGDLDYRAIATVGHQSLHLPGNDGGPDGCNHDWNGIFVLSGAGVASRSLQMQVSLYDVARTILGLLGVGAPADLLGVDRSS